VCVSECVCVCVKDEALLGRSRQLAIRGVRSPSSMFCRSPKC